MSFLYEFAVVCGKGVDILPKKELHGRYRVDSSLDALDSI